MRRKISIRAQNSFSDGKSRMYKSSLGFCCGFASSNIWVATYSFITQQTIFCTVSFIEEEARKRVFQCGLTTRDGFYPSDVISGVSF